MGAYVDPARFDRLFSQAEVQAAAHAYGNDAVFIENAAHDFMLDPAWPQVARHIEDWARRWSATPPG